MLFDHADGTTPTVLAPPPVATLPAQLPPPRAGDAARAPPPAGPAESGRARSGDALADADTTAGAGVGGAA